MTKRRRSGIDGNILRTRKRHCEQHVCSKKSDGKTHDAAEDSEENTFREQLPDNPAALRSRRCPHAHLRTPAHTAHQLQVSDVGTGHKKNQRGYPCQQMKLRLGVVL